MNKCKQPWTNRPQQSTSVRIPGLEVSRLQDPGIQDKLNAKMLEPAHVDLASDADLWITRPQQDNAHELAELAPKKQTALAAKDTSLEAARQYQAIKKADKKRVRAILNEWWAQKAEDIQLGVDTKSPKYQSQGTSASEKSLQTPEDLQQNLGANREHCWPLGMSACVGGKNTSQHYSMLRQRWNRNA